jgi:hypothetical protein
MKSVFPAERVRLKDGVLPHQEIREWEFQTTPGGARPAQTSQIKIYLGSQRGRCRKGFSPRWMIHFQIHNAPFMPA